MMTKDAGTPADMDELRAIEEQLIAQKRERDRYLRDPQKGVTIRRDPRALVNAAMRGGRRRLVLEQGDPLDSDSYGY